MGFDVFNALDLMNNKEFLEKLKFGIGDGNLQYYLYNWKCPYMEPYQVSISIFTWNLGGGGGKEYQLLPTFPSGISILMSL